MPDSTPKSREQIASQRLTDVVHKINQVATPDVAMWHPTKVNSHHHILNAACNLARVLAPQIVSPRDGKEGLLHTRLRAVLCEYGITEDGLRLIVFYLSIP